MAGCVEAQNNNINHRLVTNINTMSISKTHFYNLKLSFKALEANCQRSSCRVHIFVKAENEQRKLKQVADMKKNTALFNADMTWQNIGLKFDPISATYLDYSILVSIHYQTSDQGSKVNKLKVGQVPINLAKLLNTKTYRINSQYVLEKCYDPQAKLKLSIDLTQTEDSPTRWDEEAAIENNRVSSWKVSKIRQKMNEDEKNLLQNKLYEYEERIEKYRVQYNDQAKRLSDQLERKEQKLTALLSQNNSLAQALQGSQIQQEKSKTKISTLEKQVLLLQEEVRSLKLKNQQLSREAAANRMDAQDTSMSLQQVQEAKDRKQQYYKQQLEKYLQRYTDSERSRNRVVLEMENKVKEQVAKKDEYYRDIVSKLEAKLQTILVTGKQTNSKKEKQCLILMQKCTSVEKQLRTTKQELSDAQQQNTELHKSMEALNIELLKFQQKVKLLESESQMSTYSSANLQREAQRLKMEIKTSNRTLEECKFQIEMANKTIEEQDAMIVKLNRSMKMLQEREYYMEEKYQEELEIKSMNQQRIAGSHNYYKTMTTKLEIRVKILEERAEEAENQLHTTERDRQKLQEESKNIQRQFFESTHQILLLQTQVKKLSERCGQLEEECTRKQEIVGQLQQKIESAFTNHELQVNGYMLTIKDLDQKNHELAQKIMNNQNQWEEHFEMENSEKNALLTQLEAEVERLRRIDTELKMQLVSKQQKILQLEAEAQSERDKNRLVEREQTRKILELEKISMELQNQIKQTLSFKTLASELKSELTHCKAENIKILKRLSKQKESFTEIIKWILDRDWDGDREFVKLGGSQIELDTITLINTGLERWYCYWEKSRRTLDDLREQNQKVIEQLERNKLQTRYEEEFRGKESQESIDFGIKPIERFHPVGHIVFDIENQHEASKFEELKNLNHQLQKDCKTKISQIESLNQQIFEERAKTREYLDQIQKLKQQVQDLSEVLSRKSALVNSLQAQIFDRETIEISGFSANLINRSPNKALDYKSEAEAKFKEQKIIMELERKLQELDRENNLQKSKIELLESKLKAITEKSTTDSQRSNLLQKNLKQKQELLRRISKDNEEKQQYLAKIQKQLELVNNKLSKKQKTIDELKNQVEQQRKIGEILGKEVEEWQNKFSQKQKKMERESFENRKNLLEAAEKLAFEKIQKQKIILEQSSQITYLTTAVRQSEDRIVSLQSLITKSKKQNQTLYAKYLESLNQKNELEEQTKDLKMSEAISKQNYEKRIVQFQQKLQNKQYELEQLKFSSESKIIELQRRLEENDQIIQF